MSFITKIAQNIVKKEEQKKLVKEKENIELFIERPHINPFIKLYTIIIKNFKLVLRSKLSALLFILGPLVLIFLLALAFNTTTLYDLNIAVYSESYSTLSDTIVTNLSDSQYNVIKMSSEEECIDSVKFDNFQVCMVFPKDMILDNSANNIIKIYVDNSRLNIANLISNQVTSKVSIAAESISEDMVSTILIVLDTVNNEVAQTSATTTNLQSINSQISTSTSSISSDISEIDLSSTAVDTSATDSAISSIQNSYNISSSSFSTLKTAIDNIVNAYNSLNSKTTAASTKLSEANTEISAVKTNIASEKEKIKKISDSLGVISSSIDTVKITNVENIVTPVRTKIEPISFNNNYLLYIIPSILILVFMFVSILLSSSNIIAEKTSTAYFRNFITPTNDFLFILGQYISIMVIALLQIAVVIATLFYFVPEPGIVAYLLVGVVLATIASLFIFVGMLVGYMFNTKETVTLASLSIGIFLLFFSNTIIPLETISGVTRKIIYYNPFILGESIIKKLLLFNAGFNEISLSFFILIGFAIAVLAGAIVSRYMFKKFFSA